MAENIQADNVLIDSIYGEIPYIGLGGVTSAPTNSLLSDRVNITQVWSDLEKIPFSPPAGLVSSGDAEGVVRLRVRVPLKKAALQDGEEIDPNQIWEIDLGKTAPGQYPLPQARSVAEVDYMIVSPPNNLDGNYSADVSNALRDPPLPAAGYTPIIEYSSGGRTSVVPSKDRWRVNQGLDRIEFWTSSAQGQLPADATDVSVTFFEYTGATAASNTGEAPKNAVKARSIDLEGSNEANGLVVVTGAGDGKTIMPDATTTTLQIYSVDIHVGDRVLVDNSISTPTGGSIAGNNADYVLAGGPGGLDLGGAGAGSEDNGIYVRTADVEGKWVLTRARGFDNSPSGNEVVIGCYTFVTEGPWAKYGYYVKEFGAGGAPGEVDVDPIVFDNLVTPGDGATLVASSNLIQSNTGPITIAAIGANNDVNISPTGNGDVNLVTAGGTGSVVVQADPGEPAAVITTAAAANPNLSVAPAPGGDLGLTAQEDDIGGGPVGGDLNLTATGDTIDAGDGGNVTIAAVGSTAAGGAGGDLLLSATAGDIAGGTATLTSNGGTTVSATGDSDLTLSSIGAGESQLSSQTTTRVIGDGGVAITSSGGDVATTGKNVTLTATAATPGDAAEGTVTAAHPANGAFVVEDTGGAGTATITSGTGDALLVAADGDNGTTVRATGVGSATLETTGAGNAVVQTADGAANVVIDSANLVDIDGASGITLDAGGTGMDLTTSAGNVDISAFADFTASGVNSTITASTGTVTLQHPDAGRVFVENTVSTEARISAVAGQDLLVTAAADRTATVSAGDVFITSTGAAATPAFNHVNLEHPTNGTVTIRNTDAGVNTARLTSDAQDNLYIYAAAGRTLTLGRNNATATDVTTINGYNIQLTPTADTDVTITATGTGDVVLSSVDAPGTEDGIIDIQGALRMNKYGSDATSNPAPNASLDDNTPYVYLYARQRTGGTDTRLFFKDDQGTFEIPSSATGAIGAFEFVDDDTVPGPQTTTSIVRPFGGAEGRDFCVGDQVTLNTTTPFLAGTNSLYYDHTANSLYVGGSGGGAAWDTRAGYGLVSGLANKVSGVTDGTNTFTADYSAAVGQGNTITGIVSTDGFSAAAAATHGFASGQGNAITGLATPTTATAAIYGFVHGNSNTVTAPYGVAFGQGTTAGGTYAFAHGNGASAGGQYSFAFGDAGTASNGTATFAHGVNAMATLPGTYAHGVDVGATGNYAFARGLRATASGEGAFAAGIGATGGANPIRAGGKFSFAFGHGDDTGGTTTVTATGAHSFAFGDATAAAVTASGTNSFAFGAGAAASGSNSIAFGNGASAGASNSVVLGGLNVVVSGTGSGSATIGGNGCSLTNSADSAIIGGNASVMANSSGSAILGGVTSSMTNSDRAFIVGGNNVSGNTSITDSEGAVAVGENITIGATGAGHARATVWNCGTFATSSAVAGEFRLRAPNGVKILPNNTNDETGFQYTSDGIVMLRSSSSDDPTNYPPSAGGVYGRIYVAGTNSDLWYSDGQSNWTQLNAPVFQVAGTSIIPTDPTNVKFTAGSTDVSMGTNAANAAILGCKFGTIADDADIDEVALIACSGDGATNAAAIDTAAVGCAIIAAQNNNTISGGSANAILAGASANTISSSGSGNLISAATASTISGPVGTSAIIASFGEPAGFVTISGGSSSVILGAQTAGTADDSALISSTGSANSIISALGEATLSGGGSAASIMASTYATISGVSGDAKAIIASKGISGSGVVTVDITGTGDGCALIAAVGDTIDISSTGSGNLICSAGLRVGISDQAQFCTITSSSGAYTGNPLSGIPTIEIDGTSQRCSMIATGPWQFTNNIPAAAVRGSNINGALDSSIIGAAGCDLWNSTQSVVAASAYCQLISSSARGAILATSESNIVGGTNSTIMATFNSLVDGTTSQCALVACDNAQIIGTASNSLVSGSDLKLDGSSGVKNNCILLGASARIDAGPISNCFVWSNGNVTQATTSVAARPYSADTFNVFCANPSNAGTANVVFHTSLGADGGGVLGVTLTHGDTNWNVLSDRNKKENLVELDYEDTLANLEQLPLFQFNYIGVDPDKICYGPMAQDWYPLFPSPARDQLSINSMDPVGVALAAVRGVAAREKAGREAAEERLSSAESSLAEAQTTIAAQAAEVAALQSQMAAVLARLDALESSSQA